MADLRGLRVVMVIQSYLPRLGGAEKQLAAVCRELRKQGIEPSIVTRRYPGMSAFESIEGTPVYRVPAPRPKALAALCYLFFGFLRIRNLHPQVLHAHELLSPTDLAILAKRNLGCPLVVKVLRGGKLGDLDKLRHRRGGQARIRRLKQNVDIFLTISREIEAELAAEGIDPARCRFLPNGVDTHIYQPVNDKMKREIRAALGLPEGYICLYSGRLAPEKGLDVLLNAWNKISSRHPQAHLLLLGSGPQEAALKEMAGERVIFGGYVPDPCLFYQACDLFVLPSLTEGLSNAMLEAMACGLPLVATRVGAAGELNPTGENGRLVMPGNTEELAQALDFCLSNPKESRRMGANGIQFVQSTYSLDQTVARLTAIYAELAGEGA
jgi:glycosyltransferase involved in cell wall biosynthesis